jgi:hypothetical protein
MSNPDCYGKFPNGTTPCAKCDYFDSCRYYAATAKMVNGRAKHLVSFEKAEFMIPDEADCDHIPGEEVSAAKEEMIESLGQFFRYLIDLDDYTLAMICGVISHEKEDQPCTVSMLSRHLGCSRQATHRKILTVIAGHPELSGFFSRVMTRLSRARSMSWRHSSKSAAKGGEVCSTTLRLNAKL